VFPDAFLPNLALFVLGQAAAWFYLRTGRFWVGAISTASLWLFADWAVVARFVFAAEGADYLLPLGGMQVVAIGLAVVLAVALWRRRWSKTGKARDERFGEGLRAYLREDLPLAQRLFRSLVSCNPWDAAAWLALGNVERRLQRPRKAAACYRRALGVDRASDYVHLVHQQQRLLGQQSKARAVAASPGASVAGATIPGASVLDSQRSRISTDADADSPGLTTNSAGRQ